MDKELTFYPSTGRTRDLIYSEYSSCERSIHLLVQEGPGVPYDFVLKGYRETVSAYLSSANILPPPEFLRHLLERFDSLCVETGLPEEHWKRVGIHVVLRCVDTAYVLTTGEQEILLHTKGRVSPLADLVSEGVKRLRLDAGELQADLFPRRFSDIVAMFKIDRARLSGSDLVLGCAKVDKAAVLEGLSGSVWVDESDATDARAARRAIVSPSVSRKVLAVRFGVSADGRVSQAGPVGRSRRVRVRVPAPRRVVVPVGAILVAVLIGVFWRKESAGPERVTSAQVSQPDVSVRTTEEALMQPEGRTEEADDRDTGISLNEKWRKPFDKEVTSSPVLFEEKVIFGCRDGGVYALHRDTGAQLWKFVATAGVGSSPVLCQDRVIIADYNGNVFALESRTGERVWSRTLPARVVSSPGVAGDRLVVGCYDGKAYCLSALDGSVLWTRKTGARIRGSVVASDDTFFIPSHDGFVYAVSAGAGEVKWRAGLGGAVLASPAAHESVLVVGGADNKIHCFDAGTGASIWAVATGAAVESRALIADGHVFAGSNEGRLYCVRLEDGSVAWNVDTGRAVLGRPAARGGVLFAGSYDGRVYAIEISTGRVLDTFDTGAPVYSSPALDDSLVYFGTNKGEFICLACRNRATT